MIRKTIIVLSLQAAVATVAAWGVSYRGISIGHNQHKGAGPASVRSMWLWLDHGHLFFTCMRMTFGPVRTAREQFELELYSPEGFSYSFGHAGDGSFTDEIPRASLWYPRVSSWGGGEYKVSLPLTWPLVLALLYPTIAFTRGPWRRHRRRMKGLCSNCAYDLTSNVSGLCPECGKRIETK